MNYAWSRMHANWQTVDVAWCETITDSARLTASVSRACRWLDWTRVCSCYRASVRPDSGRRRHYVLNLSYRSFVRPSVRYQTCEHNILNTNEPIFMQLWGSGQLWGQEVISQGHTRPKIHLEASSSSMSRSRRGPLRRSNSIATADGTPPEFHW